MKNIIYNNMDMFINFKTEEQKEDVILEIKLNELMNKNSDEPLFVYLSDYGLPKTNINKVCDKITINTICKEYLYFSIAINLLKNYKSKKIKDEDRESYFISNIKRQINNNENINSIDDILGMFVKIRNFYEEEYFYYTKTCNFNRDLKTIEIPYLDIEFFINKYKKLVGNNSYICIFINDNEDVNETSKRCVNSLMDINYDVPFTVKVLTNEGSWKNFDDLYGIYIDPIVSNYEYNLVKKISK